jgi:transposase
VFLGSPDSAVFADFVKELLEHCGRWLEPKSVLVVNNALFHHGELVEMMCDEAGVKLVFLPPCSPDLNPIEEFFSSSLLYNLCVLLPLYTLKQCNVHVARPLTTNL